VPAGDAPRAPETPAERRQAEAGGIAGTRRAAIVRTVTKAGKPVLTFRRHDSPDAIVIDCDVYPLSTMRVEPLRQGPYRFRHPDEAEEFLAEAIQAVQYLGCDVS
jgi:hypothetical protein